MNRGINIVIFERRRPSSTTCKYSPFLNERNKYYIRCGSNWDGGEVDHLFEPTDENIDVKSDLNVRNS